VSEDRTEKEPGLSDVIVEMKEGVATVTLNRPHAMNALSRGLQRELREAFERLAGDDSVDVVIVTGAGDRAFSAGLDLKELSGQAEPEGRDAAGAVSQGGDLVRAIEGFDRPVIGAINGFAITGGFELALACDVLIGSTHAKFADTHARVGIMPGWGLSQKLSRLIGISRAKELSLTGNYLDAETACAWGLLNRVVEPEALLPTCEALARDMQSCDPDMLRNYKRVIDEGFAANYAEGRQIETAANRAHSTDLSADRVANVRARGQAQSTASDG
jgi:enoyl-CoA hydratase